jgi:HD-GYP domain-containing protein (c-di-GMP phosphodiesterase class II)
VNAGTAGPEGRVRLAELVAALSLAVDLGFGQPMEHVLRQCLIAVRMAELLELDDRQRLVAYYTALLVNVGCHSDAHEQAKWFGDDIALKAGKYRHEMRSLAGAAASLRMLGAGNPVLSRFRIGLEFTLGGWRDLDGMINNHAALARDLAGRLSLPEGARDAVGAAYEQWDGRGWPGRLKGQQVPLAARLAQLAEFAEVAHRIGGTVAAVELARRRAGKQFDPRLAALLCHEAKAVFDGLEAARTWDAVIGAEPALGVRLTEEQFDAALLAVADFVDLKSPYTLGHARAVAGLVEAAARELRMDPADVRLLRRAGLVHGLGRLGVSNAIWDKPGPLGAGEWERVRLQPYLTERMLCQSSSLAPLGAVAAQLRERLDGSGYPRGLVGGAISRPARILGAADVYRSMVEPRPYREARTPQQAADELRGQVRAGRLDGEAVAAVLRAAGLRQAGRRPRPQGLTGREVDVLRLLARGCSSRQIATELVISPKTARNHIEHIYAKIGATSRAAACLYAVRNGLLES